MVQEWYARLSLPRIWISLFWIGVVGLCTAVHCSGAHMNSCAQETVDERDNRESVTETHRSAPNLDTIRGMLSKIKGPVRFVDLKGKERPCVHSPPPPAQPQQAYEPTEAEQATAPTPIVPEDTPTVDETAPKTSVAATEKPTSRQSGPVDDPMSQEATAEPSTNDAKRAMAIRTVITGREAVGLPPLKKTKSASPPENG